MEGQLGGMLKKWRDQVRDSSEKRETWIGTEGGP